MLLPYEIQDLEKHLWIFLTAAYGLVNANAKWQIISDQVLVDIGFETFHSMPQLFMISSTSGLNALLAKIVDDILLRGPSDHVDHIMSVIQQKFTLGTVTHGPELFLYFGRNITQYDDFRVTIDGEDKLSALDTHLITIVCSRKL